MCRELGIQASDYAINKRLMYARKLGHLRGLDSVRTRFNYEDYAFASEFAATELKYKTGASIDDILCDPDLASQFDAIAKKLAPGFTSLRYRWAILSIRKAGRKAEWKPGYQMPELTGPFRLIRDRLEDLPAEGGIYLLSEREKPLYARATRSIRHGVKLHRQPQALSAVKDIFWQPKLDDFVVTFAVLDSASLFRPVERKLIEEKRPVFNVPRVAA
jgi:site-specific DNA-methyltransferase (adenine-specific)